MLGRNMAFLIKLIYHVEQAGIRPIPSEVTVYANFSLRTSSVS